MHRGPHATPRSVGRGPGASRQEWAAWHVFLLYCEAAMVVWYLALRDVWLGWFLAGTLLLGVVAVRVARSRPLVSMAGR